MEAGSVTADPDDHDYWRRWHLAEWTTWQALADLGMVPQAEADLAHEVYMVHCMMAQEDDA